MTEPATGEPTGKHTGDPEGNPTGAVTFLFTDIQGSTAMWERDAKRMQETLARHDEILKATVAEHGGRVFKMVGDACCAAFPSAPDGLRAALAAQGAIFSEPWDERSRVRVRMALHTGNAEERGGDYFGPTVNRVARLLSAGHGGQTLLSRATKERVEGHLPEGVSVRDMGERRLKDLKEPERIHQLLAPGLPSEFPPLKTLETSSNEDRYRLIRQVGSGGMAEVYLAYDEFLRREVAFKVLDRKYAQDGEAIERFRREARNAASLRHPNIVATHDRGETEGGTYYIVMEYMEGGTLEDLISREGPLPPRVAAEIALEIADALRVAHENGVIHRDIKPQNILLSASGEAKVADFGIARAASATTMTQAGSVMGTVHYISPEQALGEPATPQSDLYSLGVVLYEMLTGELPYDAETPVGVVMKHVSGPPRSPRDADPEIPGEIDAVAGRLLSRSPEERHPDAAALAEDLEEIVDALPPAEKTRDALMGTKGAGTRTARATRPGTSGRKLGTGGGGIRTVPTGVPGTNRQRVGVLVAMGLVLLSIGVIAAVALTREDPSAEAGRETPPEARTIPQWDPDDPTPPALPAGRYLTDVFAAGLSFEVGKGWATTGEYVDGFELLPPTKANRDVFSLQYSSLGVNRIDEVFDREKQGEIKMNPDGNEDLLSPVPDDTIAWLQGHPYLRTSEPQPVEVGGVRGTQIDIEVSPVPTDYSSLCGDEPCVVLGQSGTRTGSAVLFPAGGKTRLVVLRDVEDETVLIHSNAYPAKEFDTIVPKTQKVVDTVEWQTTAGDPDQTLPTEGQIEPGPHRTDEFEPPFSYDLGEGWSVYGDAENPDIFSLGLTGTLDKERPSLLGFYRPQAVVDPEDPDQSTLMAAPTTVDGWVEWFREHPRLDAQAPVPVTVGGVPGVRIDQTVSSVPEGQPWLALWSHQDGFEIRDEKGARGRVIVLEVEGEPLLISASAADDAGFEALLPKAQQVLDTLEWDV